MKIALAVCPYWNTAWPTHAPALLQGALKQRGHSVRVFDINAELTAEARHPSLGDLPSFKISWDDPAFIEKVVLPEFGKRLGGFVDEILSASPRLVGFSIFFSNRLISLWMASRIKERDPSVTIVFGGPDCGSEKNRRTIIASGCVDALVHGDGDIAFPKLVDELERGGKLRPGPGVWLRGEPSTWTPEANTVTDMDALPHPDFDGFRLELYDDKKTLHSCRGCVRRCVFCSDWRLKRYQQMGGDRMFELVRHQLENDPKHNVFHFADSLINGSTKSLSRFCDRLLESKTTAFWGSFAIIRPEMTPEFLAKMWSAGARFFLYGIETGSRRLLERMNKHVTPELNERVLIDNMQAGIKTTVTLMVGFPDETDEMFQETLDFVARCAEGIGELTPSLFSIYEMSARWSEYGLPPENHQLYWSTKDGANNFDVRLDRLARLLNTAEAHGVPIRFEGRVEVDPMRAHIETLRAQHRDWRGLHAAL